ncbi:ABC-F family ATP-binding cassette domain-containing protein [soil metagenome]
MLSLSAVGRSHGARNLFADVSLRVVPGDRIALVGPNGAGKTTLLEIISGDQQADAGEVARAKGLRIGFLRQEVADSRGRSVLAEVLADAGGVTELQERLREVEARMAEESDADEQAGLLAEYAWLHDRFEHLGGYGIEPEARRVLGGLGFDDARIDRDVGELSGGWMMRVALARLLLAGPDVLLLDEPTNHLDLASVEWLQTFLCAYGGALVLVSHDRDFINTIATKVVELAGGKAVEYVGDYEAFVAQRELRLSQQVSAARNQQRKIAQTERFIERFRYKASKARQVQSRVKALDKLDRVEVDEDRQRALRFRFPQPPRSGRDVIALDRVVKGYGRHIVYDGLDLTLERGWKVALVGPNGAGKSTLLKLLAGALAPDAGERRLGHNTSVAYFAQHQVDALDLGKTVLGELSAAVDTSKVNPRSMLGSFLFSGEDVDKRVGVLSGGERSRLALAKLLAHPANLLCMDEPTNHLDISSRDVLEDALLAYPGTVVLITHDRHLIRSVADHVVDVRGGQAVIYPGDYEYFLSKTGGGERAAANPDGDAAESREAVKAREGRDAAAKRTKAERRNRVYRATKDLRLKVDAAERDLVAAEAEVAELTKLLADPEVYGAPDRAKELAIRHNAAKDRAASHMDDWERLAGELEAATQLEAIAQNGRARS